MFRLGLNIPRYAWNHVKPQNYFDHLLSLVDAATSSGFDAVFIQDHFRGTPLVAEPSDPMLEAYAILAAIAATRKGVILAPYVTPYAFRHPAVLAKQITTIDLIAGPGRVIMGLGSGGFEQEHRDYGVAWGPDRWNRFEEAVQILLSMFQNEATTFDGKYYSVRDAYNVPRPATPGGPPIMIAGVAGRRIVSIGARYGDIYHVGGSSAPTVRAAFDLLDEECARIGRQPSTVRRAGGGLAVVGETDADAFAMADDFVVHDRTNADAAQTSVSSHAIIGGPERVTEQVGRLREAGVEALVACLGTRVHRPEDVMRIGSVLSKAMA